MIDEFVSSRRRSNDNPSPGALRPTTADTSDNLGSVDQLLERFDSLGGEGDAALASARRVIADLKTAEEQLKEARDSLRLAPMGQRAAIAQEVVDSESRVAAQLIGMATLPQSLREASREGETRPAPEPEMPATPTGAPANSPEAEDARQQSKPKQDAAPSKKNQVDVPPGKVTAARKWRNLLVQSVQQQIQALEDEEALTIQQMRRAGATDRAVGATRKQYAGSRSACSAQITSLRKLDGRELIDAYEEDFRAAALREAARRDAQNVSAQDSVNPRASQSQLDKARAIWGNVPLVKCPFCGSPVPGCSNCAGTGYVPADDRDKFRALERLREQPK
ncbi:MAG TPA: hypothetical protein VI172_07740 [Candidatus Dormibacteraeota bacterium]|jgi:hypothetical protein